MNKKINITEVGPRDGLQNEKTVISTEDKSIFINMLEDSGLEKIEITSFVRPELIPQLSDAADLCKKLSKSSFNKYSALVPNLKGYVNAKDSGIKEIALFTAASEAFTKKNINKTIDESILAFKEVCIEAIKDGIKIRGYISTVIACPYSGKIKSAWVKEVVDKLIDLGVYEISLGDTIGVAVPLEVETLLDYLFKYYSTNIFALHFHDTYGMAIANTASALKMGIASFDSSAGGLGGCPYAVGASGNLATEDLVYFLEGQGYHTGIDLEKLIKASRFIEDKLGKSLSSKSYQALKSKINREIK